MEATERWKNASRGRLTRRVILGLAFSARTPVNDSPGAAPALRGAIRAAARSKQGLCGSRVGNGASIVRERQLIQMTLFIGDKNLAFGSELPALLGLLREDVTFEELPD